MRLILALMLVCGNAFGQMPDDHVRRLNLELEQDILAMDAFVTSHQTKGSFPAPERWFMYGRIGPINFVNRLGEVTDSGTTYSLRKTGPKMTGRFYIGITKKF